MSDEDKPNNSITACGMDILLEDTGHINPNYLAPALAMLLVKLFRNGFDETASVSLEVKNGVASLTVTKPSSDARAALKKALDRAYANKPGEA